MRILITNNTLSLRGGSELYARDVATALRERGHSPILFSTVLGPVAEELRAATLPVIDDLDLLTEAPDVIHGHHHVETMMAVLRFPGVPAISWCHGWMPWEEAPARFPTIRRWVAVDEPCRERLVTEHGIPPDRVVLLPNFVDLRRFRPRDPLPDRPRRALVFSNYADESSHLPAVREACARRGIALEVIGQRAGAPHARPEEILGDFDLVFAKGRAALEALAVGCAVILCDAGGLGGFVTEAALPGLRRLNLGFRTLREALSPENVGREIDRYDPAEAAAARRHVRHEAGLDPIADRLVALYEEVRTEHAALPAADPAECLRDAWRYLEWLSPRLKQHDALRAEEHAWSRERVERERHETALQRDRERLHASLAELDAKSAQLEAELRRRERDPALAALRSEVVRLRAERDAIQRTLTWRLRSALRRIPGLAALVQSVNRLVSRGFANP